MHFAPDTVACVCSFACIRNVVFVKMFTTYFYCISIALALQMVVHMLSERTIFATGLKNRATANRSSLLQRMDLPLKSHSDGKIHRSSLATKLSPNRPKPTLETSSAVERGSANKLYAPQIKWANTVNLIGLKQHI